MSFLPPSNQSLIPFTDSGLSNLIATIGRINDARTRRSAGADWLLGQVKEFSESLDSYIADGGDPSELLWTIHFCRSLATCTADLLGGTDDLPVETMKEVVSYITAITEVLGEPHYGSSVNARWSGFILNRVCRTTFGES